MHANPPRYRRHKHCRGVTFIELVVALLIIGLTLFAMISAYDYYMTEAKRIRAKIAIVEIENPVRQAVFETMKSFLRDATAAATPCRLNSAIPFLPPVVRPPATLAARLNQVLPGGIQLTVLRTGDGRVQPELNPNYSGAQLFNDGLARCANSPMNVAPPVPADISASQALYFCLQITAAPGTNAGASGSLLSMQPVFAEFTYTTIHSASFPHPLNLPPMPNFGPITCAQLAGCVAPVPPHGLMGELYYAIHWSPALMKGQRARFRTYSVLARGG